MPDKSLGNKNPLSGKPSDQNKSTQNKKYLGIRFDKNRLQCMKCSKKLVNIADSDGRAEELIDIAVYCCEQCSSELLDKNDSMMMGDYKLLKKLGEGSYGVAYLALQKNTCRVSVLKLTRERTHINKLQVRRFKREISIMKELLHPNLVRLYDEGVSDRGHCYLVSEYLEEGNLNDLLNGKYEGQMPFDEACKFIIQALEGLVYLHEKGFVHRDIKLENILLKKNGDGNIIAKLGDFGLARNYRIHGETITRLGDIGGTIKYCSPELISSFKDALPISDVYSMGTALYLLVSGEFQYHFYTPDQIQGYSSRHPISIIFNEAPIPIEMKVPNIPSELAKIIHKAIEKNVYRRFQTAKEFLDSLRALEWV